MTSNKEVKIEVAKEMLAKSIAKVCYVGPSSINVCADKDGKMYTISGEENVTDEIIMGVDNEKLSQFRRAVRECGERMVSYDVINKMAEELVDSIV